MKAGMIVLACFTPNMNVFLNVCCEGISEKLVCMKYIIAKSSAIEIIVDVVVSVCITVIPCVVV